ncbi:uncharacterized protein LOC127093463 [Lathyrus oleraceus]|uniref:uncharacterized protein LOC127093463 n=1 Tax=Pisum sativum TaxID=3888 RepID=UPI0021CEDD0D|nr:uncharacterized protein LOC127093463 [Pisum sativum]
MTTPQALPPKIKDPGKLTITCTIGGAKIPHALYDSGSRINVMMLEKIKELKIGEIISSNTTLTLADSSVTHLLGVVQDMLVHVDGLIFPADFVVIDMKGDSGGLVILGRSFLATGKAKIDVETSELVLKFNEENVVFNTYEWTPYMEDI